MSVILECQPGDPIYCICSFHTSPRGMPFSWRTSREIKLGEKVTYRGSEEDAHFKDHPARWQVIYETADGTQFQAVADHFVTEDHWRQIERHFQSQPQNGEDGARPAGGTVASTTS
jgi:hypothetical protein